MTADAADRTAAAVGQATTAGELNAAVEAAHSAFVKARNAAPATRAAWLEAVANWIDHQRAKKQPGIITCSALKRSYRQIVIGSRPDVRLVYLRGSRDLIARRLSRRHGHFMPASLLQSQFDTLEEPGPEEDPVIVDVGPPASQIAETIIRLLGHSATVGRSAAGV